MITSGKTWRQGFEHCKSAGSQLVKVTDQEELTYIYFTFVKPLNSGSAWMGLSLKNGSFYWTDGSKPGYKNWNYGEPNNFNGREHCVEIYVNNGKWNDIPCFVKRPFVCERGVYFLNNTDHFDVAWKTGSVGVELNYQLMKQNGVVCLPGPALLFFIFPFQYLISDPKSYRDFRETGPWA